MGGTTGETYHERSKGKDVRTSNIIAAKVRRLVLFLSWIRGIVTVNNPVAFMESLFYKKNYEKESAVLELSYIQIT